VPISLIPQPDATSIEFARRHAATTLSPPDAGGSFAGGGFATYLSSVMNAGSASRGAGDLSSPGASARRIADSEGTRSHENDSAKEDKRVAGDAPKQPESNDAVRAEKRGERERAEAAGSESGKAEAKRAGSEAAEAERATAEREASEKGASDAVFAVAGSDAADEGESLAAAGGAATKAAVRTELGGGPRGEKRAVLDARRVTERDGQPAVEIDVRVGGEAKIASDDESGAEPERGTDAETKRDTDSRASELAAGTRSQTREPGRAGGQPHGEEAAKSDLNADAVARERGASRRGEPGREEGESRGDRRVEVRDLRARGNDTRGGSDANRDRDAGTSAPRGQLSEATKAPVEEAGSDASRASSFESLRADGNATTGNPTRGAAAATRTGGQTVELRRALNEQLNGEIVRSARLIVRGSDRGEIRLNLKPESLGSVRIALQMQDGHIAGRIIVDNQSVREAFEQNLAALQKAFAEGGMDASGLEVSVADSGRDSGETEDGAPGRSSTGAAAASFEDAVPTVSSIEERHVLVDLVV
jgi:flagellar hook-length control protein FliK